MKNGLNKYRKPISLVFLAFYYLIVSGCTDNPEPSASSKTIQTESSTQNDDKISLYLTALINNHILPSYQQLHSSVNQLKVSVNTVCSVQQSTPPEWQRIQSDWRQVMINWQRIQWLKLGPVSELNIHSRIQYWPDSNGAVKRGVSKLLLSSETPNLEKLSNQNVGAQGLPALEQILFSDDLAEQFDSEKRCALISVITANISQMTTAILNDWQDKDLGYALEFASGKGEFTSVKDALEELTSNWLAQLIQIVDNKLTYPLSISAPGVPQLAESSIADFSGENIYQNLLSFRSIFTATESTDDVGSDDVGFDDLLNDRTGDNKISTRILSTMHKSIALAELIRPSFTNSIATEKGRGNIRALIESLRKLQQLLAIDMLDTLELNTGFNALDGD